MKKRIFNFESGYTLIELLAVITIVVVVGVIVAGILISSLRGGSKSNVLDNVRQNGNYAVTQMSKMIIYAQSFNGVSNDGGNSYITDCTINTPNSPLPSPTSAPVPILYQYVKITSFDGGQTIFSCSNSTIASNGASLIDTSTVSLTYCAFTCIQGDLSQAPTIGINLTLTQNTTSSFAEKQATIPFQTSVTLRNNNL
jgi:prepilin-type N-terminal cleavage/methylation domain-containing protein